MGISTDKLGLSSLLPVRGFGLPLNYDEDTRLPSAQTPGQELEHGRLIPLREFTMLCIMDDLTSRHRWEKMILDEGITATWRNEILSSGQDADLLAFTGAIMVFDDGIVKSDTIVPPELKFAFVDAVKLLEDVPDSEKDWLSGSDDKVLHLVDPSLFPLAFGKSRILLGRNQIGVEGGLEMSGKGVSIPIPQDNEIGMLSNSDNPFTGRFGFIAAHVFSNKYQWLPCDFDVQGKKAKVTSWINNLHPIHHCKIYALIEQLIDYAIPLWEMALTPSLCSCGDIIRFKYEKPQYDLVSNSDNSERPQVNGKKSQCEEQERRRVTTQPEPQPFTPPFVPATNYHTIKFREMNGLQVFVKLFNVVLTPEKPEYEGGKWHFEGLVYERGDDQWLSDVFGLKNYGPAVQMFGSVEIREGRLLAFPNILQSQEQPFKLDDPTKPGHGKVVALFLVDPYVRIISTSLVPCQRMDWWCEALENNCAFGKLPFELRAKIFEYVDFPITTKDANKMREEMMEERNDFPR
ncbi:hypothetical protein BDQ17DRAFT_1536619 [Cyathus striatus]|nr:hypothetical protein BDQ17DRAFT_1536619 [Cyathus striatus]